jgi:hypothetical protein
MPSRLVSPAPFESRAELIVGFAVRRPQLPAGLNGIDVDTARAFAARGACWRGSHEVGHAVVVHVPDVACDPAELIVHRLADPLTKHRNRLDERTREIVGDRQQCAVAPVVL